ncbi:hypothetical protein AAFP30_14675 [Gordonia sp. CPCC 205515]|uniref:hypothetical protein n=1 Tax=Gordonia sp. CPCC 205515 TaxID=3140791 RepID=UPI003AF3F83D
MTDNDDWSPTARTIATATEQGIRAARAHDLEALAESIDHLENHTDTAREVHAHLMRELLETSYQDGLSGDDVSEVLTRTVTDAASWQAPVTPAAVAVVLTGALGVGPDSREESAPTLSEPEIICAALLIAADLVTSTDLDPKPYVVRAIEEIRRAQTVEMP